MQNDEKSNLKWLAASTDQSRASPLGAALYHENLCILYKRLLPISSSSERRDNAMNEAEQLIYDLLDRRLGELQNDLQRMKQATLDDDEYRKGYNDGYEAGYTELLEDIQNLMECGYIAENLQ